MLHVAVFTFQFKVKDIFRVGGFPIHPCIKRNKVKWVENTNKRAHFFNYLEHVDLNYNRIKTETQKREVDIQKIVEDRVGRNKTRSRGPYREQSAQT